MTIKTITSTELQDRVGYYIDDAGTDRVVITHHSCAVRVLLHIDEYERLKSHNTRVAFFPHELPENLKAELEQDYQGEATPELDRLIG